MISETNTDDIKGVEYLATFRCSEINHNIKRLELKLRFVEGQRGTVNAFVVGQMASKASVKVGSQP